MSTQETALIAGCSLILFWVFSTQVAASLGAYDALPRQVRSILAVTPPSATRRGRILAVALSSFLATVGELAVVLLIATRLAALPADQVAILSANVTLSGLWTAYLVEISTHGRRPRQ